MTLPALEKVVATPEEPAPVPQCNHVLASTVIQFNLPGVEKVEEPIKEELVEPEPVKEDKEVKVQNSQRMSSIPKRPKKRSKENSELEAVRKTRGMKRRRLNEEIVARKDEEEEATL